ncbi:MAG: FG-GAP-like repeat-containing protein [Planctomycetota bacterium]
MQFQLAPLAAAVLALGASATAQLSVTGSWPVANAFFGPSDPLTVTFDQPLDPATVDATAVAVFGKWSGPARGRIALSADLRTISFVPDRPLFAGESVHMTLAGSIASAGGTPLGRGHAVLGWVRSAPGTRQFELVQTIPFRHPNEGRIGTYGIHAGDVDGDGSPDIASMNEISNDIRLLHNGGCGAFGPFQTIANPGQWPSPNDGGDFDRDGRLDLVTGNQNGGAVSLYLNDGGGSYLAPAVYPTAGYVHGVAAGDFDGDGYWDVAAPNGSSVNVFLNQGDGTFGAPVAYDGGGNGEDNVGVADFDGDGILDLVIGNLFSNTMGFLRGVGDGTFVLSGTYPTGGQPFHEAVGDCNGDGHVDALFANRGTNTFGILFGNGAGSFSAATTYPVGQTPAAIDVADLDGDGDLDCVVSNYSSADYSVWWNRGDGVFEQPALLAGAQSGSCSTLVDFDRDGIVDIIGADENGDLALLYRQRDVAALQTQAPSCAASLRLDQRGDRAGFGATAPQPVAVGSRLHLGISGPDQGMTLVAIGGPFQPGIPAAPYGLLHLDPAVPLDLLFFLLDPAGEAGLMLQVTPAVPIGLQVAFQALVADPSGVAVLSNAQSVRIVP